MIYAMHFYAAIFVLLNDMTQNTHTTIVTNDKKLKGKNFAMYILCLLIV